MNSTDLQRYNRRSYDKKYKCDQCEKSFDRFQRLIAHLQRIHKMVIDENVDELKAITRKRGRQVKSVIFFFFFKMYFLGKRIFYRI